MCVSGGTQVTVGTQDRELIDWLFRVRDYLELDDTYLPVLHYLIKIFEIAFGLSGAFPIISLHFKFPMFFVKYYEITHHLSLFSLEKKHR